MLLPIANCRFVTYFPIAFLKIGNRQFEIGNYIIRI